MRLNDDYEDKKIFYLLTNLIHANVVAMDTLVNNLETLIGELRIWIVQTRLESGFTANELRFAEYCDLHTCRKRERKSDYQK